MPTYSMARPSRLVRESATTMRYCGLRILPIRRSRIFTATGFSLLMTTWVSRRNPRGDCGTDVSRTGIALRVRGRLTRAEYQSSILPDDRGELPIGPEFRTKPDDPTRMAAPEGSRPGRVRS